jgi:rare lipoprotein A
MSVILGALALALAGCGTRSPNETVATPGNTAGIYKVGNPYQVNGVWYYPTIDWKYDKTGIASWYGPEFNGKYTADGERFNMNDVTAASPTLPMPSIVEVTNLNNGRSIQIRVNDRGPYVSNRILDVSRRAAQLLGFEMAGTAPVRVRLLQQPTLKAQLLAQHNGGPKVQPPMMFAAMQPVGSMNASNAQAIPPPDGATPTSATMDPVADPPPRQPVARLSLIAPAEAAETPAAGSKVYIQAGAFSRRANAERVKAKLLRFGAVSVDKVRIDGLSLYRVRLGPIASKHEAHRVLSKVIHSGVPHARLVAFDW